MFPLEACRWCDGSGGTTAEPCSWCDGSGCQLYDPDEQTDRLVECPTCEHATMYEGGPSGWEVWTGVDYRDGSPTGYFEVCWMCGGTGQVEVAHHLITLDDIELMQWEEHHGQDR